MSAVSLSDPERCVFWDLHQRNSYHSLIDSDQKRHNKRQINIKYSFCSALHYVHYSILQCTCCSLHRAPHVMRWWLRRLCAIGRQRACRGRSPCTSAGLWSGNEDALRSSVRCSPAPAICRETDNNSLEEVKYHLCHRIKGYSLNQIFSSK